MIGQFNVLSVLGRFENDNLTRALYTGSPPN